MNAIDSQHITTGGATPRRLAGPDGWTRLSTRDALALSAWFAVLAGCLEVAVIAFKKLCLGHIVYLSPHVVWMAPVGELLIFSTVGLALCMATRVWPRLNWPRAASFACAALAYFGLGSLFHPQLHFAAILLLALGLAHQTSRLMVRHPAAFRRVMRLSLACSGGLVAALGVGVAAWRGAAEHRSLTALPQAPDGAPNVLLIMLDTVRAQSLSLYGHHRATTPQLDRLARRGARFDLALATAPWTLPTHASLFTGRFPHETSVDWKTPLDAEHPTLAEALRDHGYATAGFIANTFYCGYEHGLNRGFVHYEDYPVSLAEIVQHAALSRFVLRLAPLRRLIGFYDVVGRKSAADVNREFVRWLDQQDRGRPFFAFLNYLDAHEPYLPPAPYDSLFGRPDQRKLHLNGYEARRAWRRDTESMSSQEIAAEQAAYEGSIAYIDAEIGGLLDTLEERGVLHNTLVIVTSDHGEEFREHGDYAHGNNLYLTSVHVPLVIVFPQRVPQKCTVAEAVTLRDVPATILDLASLPRTPSFPGNSLARFWNVTSPNGNRRHSVVLSELRGPQPAPRRRVEQSIVRNGYHYLLSNRGGEQLYDLERDPGEQRNLADSPRVQSILRQCRAQLATAVAAPAVAIGDHAAPATPARPDRQRLARGGQRVP